MGPSRAQQPTIFSPPLAMQQSVWDSIMNGNFVDAKIFAFSRRSREPGRVDTPKAIFVNTHILATACSYFRSLFSFPEGIATSLGAGLPPGVEPVFDLAERDLDSDFDAPVEGPTAKTQPPTEAATPIPSGTSDSDFIWRATSELGHPTLKVLLNCNYLALMDGSTTRNPPCEPSGDYDTILRVSSPWPARTKKALRISLDRGVFEDFRIVIPPCSVSTERLVHFAGAVDIGVGSSITHFHSDLTCQHDTEASLPTWQAIVYYMYTDHINFKPLVSKGVEPAQVHSPSDTEFRGYLCSPREVLYLARKFNMCEALIDLVGAEIALYMTSQNVVEEVFRDPPPPTRVVNRGVEIIRANRTNGHIRSELQKVIEEAASGKNSPKFSAFLVSLFVGISSALRPV